MSPVVAQVPSKEQPGGGGYGFCQHLALSPSTIDKIIAAGDVWGAPITLDGGFTWTRHEQGVYDHNQLNNAGLSFSRFFSDRVYYATTAGIMVSNDGGLTKSLLTSAVTFLGNANVPNITGTKPPRSNGHLIDDDPRDGVIVAGHGSDGVWSNVSGTWARIALAGAYVRQLWIDPTDPDTLWVSVFDQDVTTPGNTTHWNGLYRIDAWKTTPVVTRTSLTPRSVNKIAFSPGDTNEIIAACHLDGVYRSLDHGWTWTRIGAVGTALRDSTSEWAAVGIRSLDPGTPALREAFDVPYDAADTTNTQKMLNWHAPPTGEGWPIIMGMHGGGGNVGDKDNLYTAALSGDIPRRFASRGFVFVNCNYVLGGGLVDFSRDFPAGLASLKTALAWIKANAATIHGDATKIAAWGGSAGASYAQMLGLPDWQATIEDTFNSADVTSINGRTTTTGSKTWVSPAVTTTFGIAGNALKYTGTVDGTTRLARASVDVASASGDILRYMGLTLAATRNRSGPHFNATDTTQNPAHDLQIEYRKNSGTSSWFIYHRRLGGTLDTLATIAADGTHGPVFALGAKIDIEIDRRLWPWIMVRAKLSSTSEAQWTVIAHLNLADSTANATNGTGVGIDLVTDGSLAALAAATVIGYQGIYGTTSPNADGGATLDDIQVLTPVDLGIQSVVSASGYADLRVGPPHVPLTSFETIMLGWFGVDDQSGANSWFQTDPANSLRKIIGTFDPAKPITRTQLARMLAGSTLFGMNPAAFYYDNDIGNTSSDWVIDPHPPLTGPPFHFFGSANETCPRFQQDVTYAAFNAAGRNHFDGPLIEYASVASPRDTRLIFAGTNHADYPGVMDLYINILRKDLGVSTSYLNDVIVVGCGNSQKPVGANGFQTMWRSGDGGDTFACVTDPSDTHVSDVVLGTTGAWWGGHSWIVGRSNATVSSIYPDKNHPGRWFASGGPGILRSDDDAVTWALAVNGMNSTGGNVIEVDPSIIGKAYMLGTDLGFGYSTDHGLNITKVPPAVVPDNSGNPHRVHVADDHRYYFFGGGGATGGQLNGGVSSSDSFELGPWVDEGYNAAFGGASAPAPRGGVAFLQGSNRVIIALSAGGGIKRGVRLNSDPPGCSWTTATVPTGAFSVAQIAKYACVVNMAIGLLFAYDPTGAIYRSRDYGVNWETFWTGIHGNGEHSDLALDGTTLYVSGPEGLYRILNAGVAGSTVDNAGAPAVQLLPDAMASVDVNLTNHFITAVTQATATAPIKILRSSDGIVWVDPTTQEARDTLPDVRVARMSSDGWLLTAHPGMGWTTGFYTSSLPPPTPTGPVFRAISTDEYRTGETTTLVDTLERTNGAPWGWRLLPDFSSGPPSDADTLLRQDGVPGAVVAQLTEPEVVKNFHLQGAFADFDAQRLAIQDLGRTLRDGGTWEVRFDPSTPSMYYDALPNPRAAAILGQTPGDMGDLQWAVERKLLLNVPVILKTQPWLRGPKMLGRLAPVVCSNKRGFRIVTVNNPSNMESLLILRVQPQDPTTPFIGVKVWRRSQPPLPEWRSNLSDFEVGSATLGDPRSSTAISFSTITDANASGGSYTRATFNRLGTWRVLRKAIIPSTKAALAGTFDVRLMIRASSAKFTVQCKSGMYDTGQTPPIPGPIKNLDGTAISAPTWTITDLGFVDFSEDAQALVIEIYASCDTVGEYLEMDTVTFAPSDEQFVDALIPSASPIPTNISSDVWSNLIADGELGQAPGCKAPVDNKGNWSTDALNQGVSVIPWDGAIAGAGSHDVWMQPGFQVNNPPSFATRMGYLRAFKIGTVFYTWSAGHACAVGDTVFPPVPNGHVYTVKNPGGGVFGATQPTWPTGFGANVTQDGVTYAEATLFDGNGNAVQAPLSATAGQQYSTAPSPVHIQFELTDPTLAVNVMVIQTQAGQADGAASARKIFIAPLSHSFIAAPTSGSTVANELVLDAYGRQAYVADVNGTKISALRVPNYVRLASGPGDTDLLLEFLTLPDASLDQFDASDPNIPGIDQAPLYNVDGDLIPLYGPSEV